MLPIVVRTGAAAARQGLPSLLSRASALAKNVFTTTPAAAGVAARRTGIAAAPGKILDAMKNNKMITALVLLDLGPEAYDLLTAMAAEDEQVAELVARYGTAIDPVSDSALPDLATQVDEMRLIADTAADLGGLEVLHRLRKALLLEEKHYMLFDQLKVMREAMR